jgi:hypothetical protein
MPAGLLALADIFDVQQRDELQDRVAGKIEVIEMQPMRESQHEQADTDRYKGEFQRVHGLPSQESRRPEGQRQKKETEGTSMRSGMSISPR